MIKLKTAHDKEYSKDNLQLPIWIVKSFTSLIWQAKKIQRNIKIFNEILSYFRINSTNHIYRLL